jgi:Zn-dependent M28 family amino/carboxypeptidase
MKFIRSGSSSARLSSDALLPSQATNVWAVGASADDVSTLSTLGRVVRNLGVTADALPPRMVKTYSGFWP